jgi:hypothetical protein
MSRHRDQPCLFRSAEYLFDGHQREQIDHLFHAGWKVNPGHSLLSCVGQLTIESGEGDTTQPPVRSSSPHFTLVREAKRAYVRVLYSPVHTLELTPASSACVASTTVSSFPQLPVTVGMAINSSMKLGDPTCMLSDVSMHLTVPTAAACCHLLSGPLLFSAHNLLAETEAFFNHDHHLLQMSIGTRDSYVEAKVESFGVDAYSYLVEGERLWYLAPPECTEEFRAHFCGKAPLDADLRRSAPIGLYVAHQKAGDAVYLPGGWIYAVQSLTSMTVAFGAAYLRAWNLSAMLDEVEAKGLAIAQARLNVQGVLDTIEEDDSHGGLTREDVHALQQRWIGILRDARSSS